MALCCVAPARAAPSEQLGRIEVGGVARSYAIHVPAGPAPKAGFPVVFAFHGGGGNGEKMVKLMGLDPLADARGFIVLYPDGLDHHWNDGRAGIKAKSDDIGFVAALLDTIEGQYPVDPKRVFATGVSNGAVFAHRVGCDLSDRFSAIAAVSGTMAAGLETACRPGRPVSVLQISGTADPIMPYDGGKVKQFLGAGEGGQVLSAAGTVGLWAGLDGCADQASSPERLPLRSRSDGTSIVRQAFRQCRDGAAVTLLTVENGGHAWPGGRQILRILFGKTSQQLDASQTIVDFFLSQPRR